MEFHLETGLSLNTTPAHKGLYEWAICETDASGHPRDRDYIPWNWRLWFVGTKCELRSSLTVERHFEAEGQSEAFDAKERRVIRISLAPEPRREKSRSTTYSMFGTAREIEKFQLEVHALEAADAVEYCQAWGSVSYSAEIDFYTETEDDIVIFHLFVKPDSFSEYVSLALSEENQLVPAA